MFFCEAWTLDRCPVALFVLCEAVRRGRQGEKNEVLGTFQTPPLRKY